MTFMEQYGQIIIALLGVVGSFVIWLQLKTRSEMKDKDVILNAQRQEMEQMKSDNRNRDQQLAIVQQLAESGAKRELLYTETQTRREEAWQRAIETFTGAITASLRDLTTELKQDRDQLEASLTHNTQTIKNLSDVLEVQIIKLNTVDATQTTFIAEARMALKEIITVNKNTNENSDHLLLTVEAIRDHILYEKEEIRPVINVVNNKLDEVLNLLKGESSHVLQKSSASPVVPAALPAVIDDSSAGESAGNGDGV